MSAVVPRMAARITREQLYARVVITAPDGRTLSTTLERNVKPSDLVVENLKRQMANQPLVRS